MVLKFIHLPAEEHRRVYVQAAAAVAPGGTLLVVGHDRSNLAEGVGGPQGPAVLFAVGEIAAELPAGFQVERADTVRRGSPAPGPVPIDTVLRATRPGAP